jgi:hypothetical protein
VGRDAQVDCDGAAGDESVDLGELGAWTAYPDAATSSRATPRQSPESAGGGSPGPGQTCKDEAEPGSVYRRRDMACSGHRMPEARMRKEAGPVDYSRQQIVEMLRRAGMNEIADTAEATLPDPVDGKILDQFCTAQGVTLSTLTDRMGASP